jgi:hypothetical protein
MQNTERKEECGNSHAFHLAAVSNFVHLMPQATDPPCTCRQRFDIQANGIRGTGLWHLPIDEGRGCACRSRFNADGCVTMNLSVRWKRLRLTGASCVRRLPRLCEAWMARRSSLDF